MSSASAVRHVGPLRSGARAALRRVRSLLPFAIVSVAAALAWALAQGRPAPRPATEAPLPPLVRVAEVHRGPIAVPVHAQGTVAPRTESDLVPEVAGRVVRVSPALAAGGFFEEGDVLVEIDPRDYQSALARAEARVARAESERALARATLARHAELGRADVASAAALDRARSAARVADSALTEAGTARDDAARALERTVLHAPFAGRVREKWVDIGQYVAPGKPVARVYAVDAAEVRLAIRDADLALLELDGAERPGPDVVLEADFAGAPRTWTGRIVRTEGAIDPRTRMLYVVARVEDPYGRLAPERGVPLAVGLFVDAEIEGRTLHDVVRIPREALREGNAVYAVDAGGRLRRREIDVIRAVGDDVVADGPLEAGELVLLSDLVGATDGLLVRTGRDPSP